MHDSLSIGFDFDYPHEPILTVNRGVGFQLKFVGDEAILRYASLTNKAITDVLIEAGMMHKEG